MSSDPANLWPEFCQQAADLQQRWQSPHDPSQGDSIQAAITDLSQRFQQALGQRGPSTVHEIQPYLTEVHRLLRLLSADLSFYRVARAPTLQQRHAQISEHLEQLSQYCEAIKRALVTPAEPKALPELPPP